MLAEVLLKGGAGMPSHRAVILSLRMPWWRWQSLINDDSHLANGGRGNGLGYMVGQKPLMTSLLLHVWAALPFVSHGCLEENEEMVGCGQVILHHFLAGSLFFWLLWGVPAKEVCSDMLHRKLLQPDTWGSERVFSNLGESPQALSRSQ